MVFSIVAFKSKYFWHQDIAGWESNPSTILKAKSFPTSKRNQPELRTAACFILIWLIKCSFLGVCFGEIILNNSKWFAWHFMLHKTAQNIITKPDKQNVFSVPSRHYKLISEYWYLEWYFIHFDISYAISKSLLVCLIWNPKMFTLIHYNCHACFKYRYSGKFHF